MGKISLAKAWLISKLEIGHGKNVSIKSMEGMRGLAVLFVFLVHYSSLSEPLLIGSPLTLMIKEFLLYMGKLGVDLFFVLSGYLIYGTIISRKTFMFIPYMKRRCIRIYPTFIIVLSIYLILSFLFPNESKLPSLLKDKIIYLIQNLLLLPGIFDIKPIIIVAWTLSYEFFYYLIMPLIIMSLRLRCWSSNQRIAFWCLLSLCFFTYCYLYSGPIRLVMFISGVILYEVLNEKKVTFTFGRSGWLLVAMFFWGGRSLIHINYYLSVFILCILLLLFCLSTFGYKSKKEHWLTFSPLCWLGNMSYSYYLIHGLILKFCFLVLYKILPNGMYTPELYYLLLLPFIGLTFAGSLCLYLAIEHPFSLTKRKP